MKGFFLGLAVAGLAVGAYLLVTRHAARGPAIVAADAGAGKPAAAEKKRKKRARGATRVARVDRIDPSGPPRAPEGYSEPEPEPEPVRLSAADLKMVGQGDDVSRPDVLRLDMSDNVQRELSQDEIDERFRRKEDAILDCIAGARPDPETYVPGRVTIKFRIQRAGSVRGVRVEAPAILHKGGLYGCIKGLIMNLHFPSSGSSQIVSYPFTLG